MKRLILILLLLIALPCLAAPTWQVTVAVKKTPADTSEARLKVHSAKHDSVQVDIWSILKPMELGWMIVDNDEGTHWVVTVPDTIPIIGPIRSALGKYNQRVSVRKEKVEELE